MTDPRVHPVILSGGSGTRLWPMSRRALPKQLLPLVSERTMLQETALRVADPARFHAPVLICNDEHRFVAAEQLRQAGIAPDAIFLEPEGRNTAPAAAVAALRLAETDPEAVMLLMPSDHVVRRQGAFDTALGLAARAAAAGHLVTFGIAADRPETGYGWIRQGAPLADSPGAYAVARFVEKPPRARAEAFLAEGGYAWNSGMFVMRADRLLAELERLEPALLAACRDALAGATRDLVFIRLDGPAFARARAVSIDHAVMERTDRAATVAADIGWSDVGAWDALWTLAEPDAAGNVTIGDVAALDAEGCYLRADGRLLAVVGVRDLIVVDTDDALLVAGRSRAQDVKLLADRLKAEGRTEVAQHRRVYRPWGFYQTVDQGERFQVKRLRLEPGARISLQKHHHRAEHWVVVRGTAVVTRGEETITLAENQSTFIPQGVVHRLENPGRIPLEVVEVQSGGYLGEDDIVRFEDSYGRLPAGKENA